MYVRGYLQGSENGRVVTIEILACVYIIAMHTKVISLYMLAVAEINLRTDTSLPPAFVVLWLTSYKSNRFVAPTMFEGS